MPNWVYNSISGYTPEMFKKYSNEEDGRDIDFNKLIPMPKDLEDMPSGSFQHDANAVNQYLRLRKAHEGRIKEFEESPDDKKDRYMDSFVYETDLYKMAEGDFKRFYANIGMTALSNPDKTLNQLMDQDDRLKESVEDHRIIAGNDACKTLFSPLISLPDDRRNCDMKYQVMDRYVNHLSNNYDKARNRYLEECKENDKHFEQPYYEKYETLEALGDKMHELKTRYGCDNWYDFSCRYWGTKWNACDTEYDEQEETLRFNTAWSVPEPILGKLQEENPDAKLDVYSEEETGWWMKYETNDGKLYNTEEGEYQWEETESGDYEEMTDGKQMVNPPREITSAPYPPFPNFNYTSY